MLFFKLKSMKNMEYHRVKKGNFRNFPKLIESSLSLLCIIHSFADNYDYYQKRYCLFDLVSFGFFLPLNSKNFELL